MLFQGKIRTSEALHHHAENLTLYLLKQMEWRLTVQQRSSQLLWSGSPNQRPTPIFTKHLPCLNLFQSLLNTTHPQWRLRTITQYFSMAVSTSFENTLRVSRGHLFRLGNKTTPSMTHKEGFARFSSNILGLSSTVFMWFWLKKSVRAGYLSKVERFSYRPPTCSFEYTNNTQESDKQSINHSSTDLISEVKQDISISHTEG